MLIFGQEFSDRIEIDAGDWVKAVTFTANGEYLVSGGYEGVQIWRVKDGERVATKKVEDGVWGIVVSKDGRFIAAQSSTDMLVWDATTYKEVFASYVGKIWDIDFSPDSSRLVSADGEPIHTASIWDIAVRKKVRTLYHEQKVEAARYSPQGDRIATASYESIRVWDSDDGRLLVNMEVQLGLTCGLLWFNNHLFVKTESGEIKQIDASTGSTISEWSVPLDRSSIALPQHGQFLAYSMQDNITLWDTSTHIQLGPQISQSNDTCSIAFSPSGQRLALVQDRKIIIKNVFCIKVRPLLNMFAFLICTSYTRNRTFILKTLRLTRGKILNSPMRKRCLLQQSQRPRMQLIYLPVELLSGHAYNSGT